MSDNTQEKGNQTGSAKRGFIIIAVFLVIIIALVAVIAFLLGRNTNTGGSDIGTDTGNTDNGREVVGSARVVLDEDSAANVMEEMRKEVEEGMFECNMSMTWTFDDGSAKSRDAYVANSTNNKYPIYFDVILNETKDLVYSSPILPVGAELANFSLDQDLDPGTYKATVMYSLIRDEESQEVISSAGFVITINIDG
jgi:hypothetical protein